MYSEYKCKGMEEILTIAGILFVGLNLGIMHTYMQKPQKASGPSEEFINFAVPTTINLFITGFLVWSIIESPKSTSIKYGLIFLLIFFTCLEMYFVYDKEPNNDLRGFFTFLIYVSSLLKVYLLITLHASVSSKVSKNIFSQVRRKPAASVSAPVIGEDYGKARKIFEQALAKSDLSPEEKDDFDERFSSAFDDEQPWQKSNDSLSAVLNKADSLSKEEKQDIRNKFRIAMGRAPR